MENKNNRLFIIIICILVLVLLVVGAFVMGQKSVNKTNSNNSNNTENNNENIENTEKEEDYELSKANEIVEKYVEIIYLGEEFKAFIAYANADSSKKTIVNNCKELFPNNESDTDGVNVGNKSYCENGITSSINYDDINESYKYLFGEDMELSKKDYMVQSQYNIIYSQNGNVFINATHAATNSLERFGYNVISATTKGNKLNIELTYAELEFEDIASGKSPFTGKIYHDPKDFMNEEKSYFEDKYSFEFQKENNHYVLKNINKI